MNTDGLIDPDKVGILQAAGAGAFLALLLQGQLGWRRALAIIASAEVGGYEFTDPVSHMIAANGSWRGPVAVTIGLTAMYFCAAIIKMFEGFAADPWTVLRRLPIIGTYFGTDRNDGPSSR